MPTPSTPAERAAQQRARKAVATNPNPRQEPIRAPAGAQAPIQAQHLAQALEAQALLAQFYVLPPEQQAQVLAAAQDLANTQATQAQNGAKLIKNLLGIGLGAFGISRLANGIAEAGRNPGVN
jgi:hypothetical protein